MDRLHVKVEEQTALVNGLLDALVELYPDVNGNADDDAYLAVLSQAQLAAQELRKRVQQLSNSLDITPMSIIG